MERIIPALVNMQRIDETRGMDGRRPIPKVTPPPRRRARAPPPPPGPSAAGGGPSAPSGPGPGARLVVGRAPASPVPHDHPHTSRRHAPIHVGDPMEVEDLGSTNGPRLAGR